MKKYIFTVITALTFLSCGGGGGDTPPAPTENKAPETPNLSEPADNLLCANNLVTFKWGAATDPNGDTVKYLLQIATDIGFSQIVHTLPDITTTSKSVSLDKGVAYYWRVQAKDSKNATSDFTTHRKFYTEGEGIVNHLPFAPELISPVLNGVVQNLSTTLEWSASDADTADVLTYDVFFGTNEDPSTNTPVTQSAKTYPVTSLTASTTYYWKIDVKDDKGGITKGQVWSFITD